MTARVTVLVSCKDEAHQIADCLDSIECLADEILVADSGSTDGTLDLVRSRANCRIVEREYVNAGNFKNWAIPQSRHEWVFVIDADERMTSELADEIRKTIRQPRYDGYRVHRLNHFLGHPVHYGDWGRDEVIRLFRRDARYRESTDHSEIEMSASRVGRLTHRMPHFTCQSYDQYLAKMHRYARQQAQLWHQSGRRPSWLHLAGNGPMRFLRAYVAERGFLDGMPGLQIAALTAYYSFLKQSHLWALWHATHSSNRCG